MRYASNFVTTGLALLTVTVCVQAELLPQASVALHVTVVTLEILGLKGPGKITPLMVAAPEAGVAPVAVHVIVGTEQLSVAVAADNPVFTPPQLVASTVKVMLPGQVMTGTIFSRTVMVCT